jgi:hypothetical protein
MSCEAHGRPGARRRLQRVFLSHTSELRAFPRPLSFIAAAESAIARAHLAVTDQAYFTARDRTPMDACLQAVREADIYLGIVGFRYGSPVRGRPAVSYTELEFEAATALRMPRVVVLLDEHREVPLPVELILDFEHGRRQAAFRQRLREAGDLTVTYAATPAEVETVAYQAIVEIVTACRTAVRARARGGRPATGALPSRPRHP